MKSVGSTVVIFVRVTGGISRAVGGLCALDAGAEVCGINPVLTIGGCRSVDIARSCQLPKNQEQSWILPFWPDSLSPCQFDAVSSVPPIECIELAVEPRLG